MENTELFAAMANAFAAIEGATKDANNPHFKSKYADLGSVVSAIKPALVPNGLWFAQVNHEQTGGVCVETILCHSSGQQFSFGKLFVPASKQDAQGYGSALTYARRYSLLTAFGVCPEDDDGNDATASYNSAPKADPVPIKMIDDSQRDELQAMIEGYGFNILQVCEKLKIESLKQIHAENFGAAKDYLNKQFDKKKAKEAQ